MKNKQTLQCLEKEFKLENLIEIKKIHKLEYLFEAIIFILEKFDLINDIEYVKLNKIIDKKVKDILEEEFKSLYLFKKKRY